MFPTLTLEISPQIPPGLSRLPELANNLFFSWHRPARALFEELSPQLWSQVRGNPRQLLRCIDQETLDTAAADAGYLTRLAAVFQDFDDYVNTPPIEGAPQVAYFCAEYGFNHGFPIYSGGLGVLAGDHCKAASDERLNFIGIGLLYGQGYFTQVVDSDGVQHAEYKDHDPRDLPVEPVRDAAGTRVTVNVPIAGRQVVTRLWRTQIGRISVILLDTNCPENTPADRDITHRLYGGDDATRIRQEMVLGIGGVRALRALGVEPAVWHMNEGHAAFLVLERWREVIAQGVDPDVALEAVAAQNAFTTHTPVAAGHDAFNHDLVLAHFGDFIAELGQPVERLLALGAAPSNDGLFNMTRLALNGSRHVNGVSRLHGQVSSRLIADHWPEVRPDDNPVGYVTNGVHVPTFLHQKWSEYFDEVAGPQWREKLSDAPFWKVIDRVSDRAYWATGQAVKADMLGCVRERLRREFVRKGQSSAQWRHVAKLLDPSRPDVLTIGFARRFATYKRAALIMRDRERLARLVNDPERPVVFLFAGKAHPADQPGQAVLREIKQVSLQPEFIGRVVFLEDYDIQLARWLVAGCDVWLNNPIAPLEASGTSGIKAAVNGRQNLSILDGWWAEGYDGHNGWGIPPVDVQDPVRRDQLEAELILDTLEEEVAPLYYARGEDGCPRDWVQRSKRAMTTAIPAFNMRRTVADYARGVYQSAAAQGVRLASHDYAGARALVEWKRRVHDAWPKVSARAVSVPTRSHPRAEPLRMRVAVQLGGLQPKDIQVEFIARRVLPETSRETVPLSSWREPLHARDWREPLQATEEIEPDGSVIFALDAPTVACGQFQGAIRVYPAHELLTHPYELGLMKWMEGG